MSIDFNNVPKQSSDHSLGQSALHRLNILVVDDDEQNLKMLQLILKYEGHTVKCISNGLDALDIVKSEEFDLVFMDIMMPLMDGLEVTRQIRAWENGRKRLAIIGLTALLDTEYGKCIKAGMDNILSKPFDTEQFHDLIANHVNRKKDFISNAASFTQSEAAILDVQGAIKRFAGDRENYTILLDEFVLSLSQKFVELSIDREAGNWNNLLEHAHNLKGLSANFGAMQLSKNALELEQYVNDGLYDLAKQKLGEIGVSIQNLRNEASSFMGCLSDDGKLI